MIKSFGSEHSATINDLASDKIVNGVFIPKKIQPVSFTVNGAQYEANSVWAATDWLKANGHYANNSVVVWDL